MFKDCLTSSNLKIKHIEKYDPLNLVHANIARVMLADPEEAILHLTWIRINYLINLQDVSWKLPDCLRGSVPTKLIGCE
jgi:hypothetical protein